jgi:hypothetical protein
MASCWTVPSIAHNAAPIVGLGLFSFGFCCHQGCIGFLEATCQDVEFLLIGDQVLQDLQIGRPRSVLMFEQRLAHLHPFIEQREERPNLFDGGF